MVRHEPPGRWFVTEPERAADIVGTNLADHEAEHGEPDWTAGWYPAASVPVWARFDLSAIAWATLR
jgi:hypothetical protein